MVCWNIDNLYRTLLTNALRMPQGPGLILSLYARYQWIISHKMFSDLY